MIGLRFAQTLRGNYHLLASPTDERAIELEVEAAVAALSGISKHPRARITGHLRAAGLAENARCEGTLGLEVARERRLPYDVTFVGDDGEGYRLRGQCDVSVLSLAESLSTLSASLYDAAGREMARATLRFDFRSELGKLLRSLRPTLS